MLLTCGSEVLFFLLSQRNEWMIATGLTSLFANLHMNQFKYLSDWISKEFSIPQRHLTPMCDKTRTKTLWNQTVVLIENVSCHKISKKPDKYGYCKGVNKHHEICETLTKSEGYKQSAANHFISCSSSQSEENLSYTCMNLERQRENTYAVVSPTQLLTNMNAPHSTAICWHANKRKGQGLTLKNAKGWN